MRIAGVELPNKKRLLISLTYIRGISISSSKKILKHFEIDEQTRINDINDKLANQISSYIEGNYIVENFLRKQLSQNIERLKKIKCRRGKRHEECLPVRGQSTHCNAKTLKKLRENKKKFYTIFINL